jgi:hypothetical protein
MHLLLTRPLFALCLALLAGCGSAQVEPEGGSRARTASLTIIVWSTQTQRPVAATGRLTSTVDGQERDIDTRGASESGQIITGLAPGPYRLKVLRRYEGAKTQAVEGTEELYLEPGEERSLTVTATDKPGELGRRTPDKTSSTFVADSLLPLSPTRAPGPS